MVKLITWFTAGGMVAKESNLSSLLMEKLLTPMALVRPSLWHSSMDSHTPFMSNSTISDTSIGYTTFPGFVAMGQWIRYRSKYSS